jgi:hypothetical protein
MTNAEIGQFIAERLEQLNLGLDLTEGSWVWSAVIQPLQNRLGPDIVESNVQDFVEAHLKLAHPDIVINDVGSPYTDLVMDIARILIGPMRREILTARRSRSRANPEELTEIELDRLNANIYEERVDGARATVSVTVEIDVPQPIWLDGTIYAVSKKGYRFFCDEVRQIPASQLSRSATGYNFSFTAVAERAGREYNVDKSQISAVYGVPGYSSATNLRAATGGLPRETNTAYNRRVLQVISERVPLTDPGIRNHVTKYFPDLRELRTVGYGHPEMKRDIIRGTAELLDGALGLGAVVDEETATALVQTYEGVPALDFTDKIQVSAGLVANTDVNVGDHVRFHGEDRIIKSKSGTDLFVTDYVLVFADTATSGSVTSYPVERGARLPLSLILADSSADMITNGIAKGHYACLPDGVGVAVGGTGEYQLDGWKLIDSVAAAQCQVADPIELIHWGRGHEQAIGPVDVYSLYYDVVSYIAPAVSLAGVTWFQNHANTINGDVVGFNETENILYVTFTAFPSNLTATTDVYLYDVAGGSHQATVTLDSLAQGKGGQIQNYTGTRALILDGANMEYDFSDSLGGIPSAGDFVALHKHHATATSEVLWGVYPILAGSDATHLKLGAGWPSAVPTLDPLFIYSWTVIRGGTGEALPAIADVEAAFFPAEPPVIAAVDAAIPTQYLVVGLADGVVYGTWNFLSAVVPAGALTVRNFVTAADLALDIKLTISDIPGGILHPTTNAGTIEIEDDVVHVGGAVDVYVEGDAGSADYKLTEVEDDTPDLSGVDATWAATTDQVVLPGFTGTPDITGRTLVLKETEDADAYRILDGTGSPITIDRDLTVTEGSGAQYYVTDAISVALHEPRVQHVESRTGLVTSLSKVVRCVEGAGWLDFSLYGVVPGESVLHIQDGPDEGIYGIELLLAEGKALQLDTILTWAATGVAFRVYSPQTAIPRPFTRVKGISISEGGADLGVPVPLMDPVDVRTGELTNAGDGILLPNESYGAPSGTLYTDAGPPSVAYISDATLTGEDVVAAGIGVGHIVTITSGNNVGTYSILGISADGVAGPAIIAIVGAWPVDPGPVLGGGEAGVTYTVGAASRGRARLYFQDPVWIEIGPDARFTTEEGYEFTPSSYARGLRAEFVTNDFDLEADNALDTVASKALDVDFRQYGVVADDIVLLLTRSMDSSGAALAATANAAGQTLTLTFEDTGAKTIRFEGTNPLALTTSGLPGGVKEQIEAAFPDVTCDLSNIGPVYTIRLRSSRVFTLTGTSLTALELSAEDGNDNDMGDSEYVVGSVSSDGLTLNLLTWPLLAPPVLTTADGVTMRVLTRSTERIGPAEMALSQDATGFYYWDMDIESVRGGDEYNLADNTQLTLSGHVSMGYRLSSDNEALTFSPSEEVTLELTPTIVDPDGDDLMTDLMFLPRRQLNFSLAVDSRVESVDSFLRTDRNRVVNASPLGKRFRPAYAHMTIAYTRGPTVAALRLEIAEYLRTAAVSGTLAVYDFYRMMQRLGITTVTAPLELAVLVHKDDRSITVERSRNLVELEDSVRLSDDTDGFALTRT